MYQIETFMLSVSAYKSEKNKFALDIVNTVHAVVLILSLNRILIEECDQCASAWGE